MSAELPEVTPQKVSEEIDVVLAVTAHEKDGAAFVMAYTDNGWGGTAEAQARSALSSDAHSRFAGIVRVRIPRALLNERWEADR